MNNNPLYIRDQGNGKTKGGEIKKGQEAKTAKCPVLSG